MFTYRLSAKHPHHIAVRPMTRLGRWALGVTAAAAVGLVMLGVAMAFSPDDPAFATGWGSMTL